MASIRAAISEGGAGRMMFFAVDFMVTNVANQPVMRHPISGRPLSRRRCESGDP
jgi:hypothetical protein